MSYDRAMGVIAAGLVLAVAASASGAGPSVPAGALRVRASVAAEPCVRAAARAYAAGELVIETGAVRGARGADVLVGGSAEIDRALESGAALGDTDVDLVRIPWVLIAAGLAPVKDLEALAGSGAPVVVMGGAEAYEARRALGAFSRDRVRETQDARALRAAPAALVPLSLAGAAPHAATTVPALTLKAAVAAGAPREAGAREFVAYLASDAGLRALAACER